jgi:hypothetical protein
MMGAIRRAVALELVERLGQDRRYPLARGKLSQGMNTYRRWCPAGMLAEIAVDERIVPPPAYDARRDAWAYGSGRQRSIRYLPKEICDWAGTGPVGPELVVPRITGQPLCLVYLADCGATRRELAAALMVSVS